MATGQTYSDESGDYLPYADEVLELKNPKTGSGTDGGQETAATWQYYQDMHEVLGGRPSIDPPLLVASFLPEEEPTSVLLVTKVSGESLFEGTPTSSQTSSSSLISHYETSSQTSSSSLIPHYESWDVPIEVPEDMPVDPSQREERKDIRVAQFRTRMEVPQREKVRHRMEVQQWKALCRGILSVAVVVVCVYLKKMKDTQPSSADRANVNFPYEYEGQQLQVTVDSPVVRHIGNSQLKLGPGATVEALVSDVFERVQFSLENGVMNMTEN